MKKSLKIIDNMLSKQGINYEFQRYKTDPSFPYFVGSYSEIPGTTEDGLQEATFSLDGYHNGEWLTLENVKDSIKNMFDDFTTVEDGVGIAITYENAIPIPIDSADMKRMQINLKIKEWSV